MKRPINFVGIDDFGQPHYGIYEGIIPNRPHVSYVSIGGLYGKKIVYTDSLGQFTGLYCPSGKIFEGHRIRYIEHKGYLLGGFEGVVVFEDAAFGYVKDGEDLFHPFCEHDELKEDFLDYVEIIGFQFKME